MKKRLLTLMLAAFVALSAGAVFAQQQDDQNQPPSQGEQGGAPPQGGGQGGGHWGHGGREGRMDPSTRAQMLSQRLNLTKEQESKVKDIYTAHQKQMQSLMQHQSGSREDNRAKFDQMRSQTNSQIRAVLSGDQQQKFDAMLKAREQHMHGGREGGQGRNGGQGGEGNDQQPSNDNGQPPSNP